MKDKSNLKAIRKGCLLLHITTLAVAFAAIGVMSVKTEAKLNNIKVSAPSGKTVRGAKGKKVKLKTIVKKLKNKKDIYKSNNLVWLS